MKSFIKELLVLPSCTSFAGNLFSKSESAMISGELGPLRNGMIYHEKCSKTQNLSIYTHVHEIIYQGVTCST